MSKAIITQSREGQRELAKFLIERGVTQAKVAELIGKSRQTAIKWAEKYKWVKKKELNIPYKELVALAYINAGYTQEQAARKMSVTISTINTWIKKHKTLIKKEALLSRARKIQPIPLQLRAKAKKLISQKGYSAKEVAVSLDIPEKRVSKWILKYGWKVKPKRRKQSHKKGKALEMISKGYSQKSTARILKVSQSIISIWAR